MEDATSEDWAQAVVDNLDLAIGFSDDAGLVGNGAPVAQGVIEREIRSPAHALGSLAQRGSTGPAREVIRCEQALRVDACRRAKVFFFLPEDHFAQANPIAVKERPRVAICAFGVWLQRPPKLRADATVKVSSASAGLSVTRAEEHRVVLLSSELPRQSVEVIARLRRIFLWIDPADESVEVVAQVRKIQVCAEAQTRIPSIAFVPGCADSHTTVGSLILVVKTRSAEEAVEPGGRRAHRPGTARLAHD